ncbi:hypothetical protein [Microbulbifer variabilis]|uniref:hypothetical protein n=1 Tax=Microbulbifer variabilis TaxID=266805 RepID=UPI001CFD8D4D|nr:hypothetical protein [Microbulbifer variabilis]
MPQLARGLSQMVLLLSALVLGGQASASETVKFPPLKDFFHSLKLEISFDRTLANVNHGAKMLEPPINYGDVILITGYVYPKGTWIANGCPELNCGVNPSGGAEYPNDQIGTIICNGNFLNDPFVGFQNQDYGEEVGLFNLNISFGDGENMLELRGKTLLGIYGSNPAPFSVLGGTGIFSKAAGDALEVMIIPNASGAFNFIVDLSGLRNVNPWLLKHLIDG